MRIINVLSDNDLIGLKIFNPNNLPVKKVFIHKNRAVVIHQNAKHFGNNSSKIIVDGKMYKYCSQCSRFFILSNANFSHSRNKRFNDCFSNYCHECSKCLASLKYFQNRDYYLLKSREQYFRLLEKKGFPKDMRRIENRDTAVPAVPKHWHPWSKKWSNSKL